MHFSLKLYDDTFNILILLNISKIIVKNSNNLLFFSIKIKKLSYNIYRYIIKILFICYDGRY